MLASNKADNARGGDACVSSLGRFTVSRLAECV